MSASFGAVAGHGTRSGGRRLHGSTLVVAASVSLVLTVLMAVLILPATAEVLAALPPLVLFGVLLVLSTLARFMAGVFAARRMRASQGLETRAQAIPSVLAGVALAWAVYCLVVVVTAWGVGDPVPWLRLLAELPRWAAEAALGAALVQPGDPEDADPRLRRYSLRRQDVRL